VLDAVPAVGDVGGPCPAAQRADGGVGGAAATTAARANAEVTTARARNTEGIVDLPI